MHPSDLSAVRRAQPADGDDLMTLSRMLWEENGIFTLDENRVRQILGRCLFPNGGGIMGVIGSPGKLEGMICLLLSQFWYSSDWVLEEVFNFVHPEHRKSTHARLLLAFAKHSAEALKIPLSIGIVSNKRTEAKVRLYRSELGFPAGAFFIHNMTFEENKGPTEVNFWSDKAWKRSRNGKAKPEQAA